MTSIAFRLGIQNLALLMLAEKNMPAEHQDWPTFATRAFDALGETERLAVENATDATFIAALAREVIKQQNQLDQLGNHNETSKRRRTPPPETP